MLSLSMWEVWQSLGMTMGMLQDHLKSSFLHWSASHWLLSNTVPSGSKGPRLLFTTSLAFGHLTAHLTCPWLV